MALTETILGNITYTTITYAQCSMHKGFQFKLWQTFMNVIYLFSGQFTGKYNTIKTLLAKPLGLLPRTCITLCAGVESYRIRNNLPHLTHQSHILQEKGIHAYVHQLAHQCKRIVKLIVIDNRIDSHVNRGSIAMGIFA